MDSCFVTCSEKQLPKPASPPPYCLWNVLYLIIYFGNNNSNMFLFEFQYGLSVFTVLLGIVFFLLSIPDTFVSQQYEIKVQALRFHPWVTRLRICVLNSLLGWKGNSCLKLTCFSSQLGWPKGMCATSYHGSAGGLKLTPPYFPKVDASYRRVWKIKRVKLRWKFVLYGEMPI